MNILIPTDLSEGSLNALPNVINFFSGKNLSFTIFHAVEPRKGGATLVLNVDDIIYEEAKSTLENFVKKQGEVMDNDRITINLEMAYGYFELALNRVLDRTHPDLVIMTSKSRHGIDKILERKQTLKFIGELKQPLMIVPYELTHEEIDVLAVAVDQRDPIQETSIIKIEKIATNFGASIKLFHIDNLTEKDFSFYEQKITQSGPFSSDIDVKIHEDIPTGMQEWMDENKAQVLTLLTHNRNFFAKLILRSVTRDVTKKNSNILLMITQ